MFADSLLESSWESRSHRGWTTLASFAVQLLGLGMLLLLPLLYTEVLPKLRLLSPAVPFSAPPAPAPLHQPDRITIHLRQMRSIWQAADHLFPHAAFQHRSHLIPVLVQVHRLISTEFGRLVALVLRIIAIVSHMDWGTKQLWFRHPQLFTHRVRPFP